MVCERTGRFAGAKNPNWKGGPVTLRCSRCGHSFSVKPIHKDRARYCSLVCWNALQKETKPKHCTNFVTPANKGKRLVEYTTKRCPQCGTSFEVRPSSQKTFCAPECRLAYQRSLVREKNPNYRGPVTNQCLECGNPFSTARPQTKYCSLKCARKRRVGEMAPCWKGGVTPEHTRIRTSREYACWRTSIYERDNYTCVICRTRGVTLHAHHIRTFADHPEQRLNVDNGVTLCKPCHLSIKGVEDVLASRFEAYVSNLVTRYGRLGEWKIERILP